MSLKKVVNFLCQKSPQKNMAVDAMLRRFKRACEKAGFVYALKQIKKRKKAAAVKREKKRVSPLSVAILCYTVHKSC